MARKNAQNWKSVSSSLWRSSVCISPKPLRSVYSKWLKMLFIKRTWRCIPKRLIAWIRMLYHMAADLALSRGESSLIESRHTGLAIASSEIYGRKLIPRTTVGSSRDFRNLSSHSIAPRFRTGIVSRVFRYIVPETTMVKQPDGTYRAVEDLDRLCVRYACDDVLPLLYEDVHAANLKEYTLVKQTMRAFAALIEEITVAISNKRPAA